MPLGTAQEAELGGKGWQLPTLRPGKRLLPQAAAHMRPGPYLLVGDGLPAGASVFRAVQRACKVQGLHTTSCGHHALAH